MIPYLKPPQWDLGPVTLSLFQLLFVAGILLGAELTVGRAHKQGLDHRRLAKVLLIAIPAGVFASHLFAILLTRPSLIWTEPLFVFHVWNGFSSLGVLVSWGVVVLLVAPKSSQWVRHLDACAYGISFNWLLLRTGCAIAHDHVGAPTEFALGVRFPLGVLPDGRAGTHHDLGLYEMIYALALVLFFVSQRNKSRFTGFYVLTIMLSYPPVRFMLDFLRVGQSHGLGLSAVQWVMIPLFGLAAVIVVRRAGRRSSAA